MKSFMVKYGHYLAAFACDQYYQEYTYKAYRNGSEYLSQTGSMTTPMADTYLIVYYQ